MADYTKELDVTLPPIENKTSGGTWAKGVAAGAVM